MYQTRLSPFVRLRDSLFVTLLLICATAASAQAGYISTYAGTGVMGETMGRIGTPGSLTFDPSGNLYACDVQYGVVWQVTPAGVPSIFAGGGSSQVNGVLATNLSLGGGNCQGLAYDAGKLYISGGGTVWVVSSNGTSNIANAFAGPGSTTNTNLGQPLGLAVDSSHNVYIATTGCANESCNEILKVNPQGTSISVYAGSSTYGYCGENGPATSACLNSPEGLAFDTAGNLYVADSYNYVIRKISPPPQSTISLFAGTPGIEFTSAYYIDLVHDIKFDAAGNLYLAQEGGNLIRQIPKGGGAITNYAGTGFGNCSTNYYNYDGVPATQANLSCPDGVAVDNAGNVYIADFSAFRIRKVNAVTPPNPCNVPGNICTIAGNVANLAPGFAGDGGPALGASFNNPLGLYLDASNNIFVADSYNNRVRQFVVGGNIQTIAGSGPSGLEYDSGDGGPATQATLGTPGAVTEDGSGNLAILDEFENGNAFPWADSDTYGTIRIVSLSTNQISTLVYGCTQFCFSNFGFFSTDMLFSTNSNPNNGVTGPGYYVAFPIGGTAPFVSSLPSQRGTSTQLGVGIGCSNCSTLSLAADTSGNIYMSNSYATDFTGGGSPPAEISPNITYTIVMISPTTDVVTTIAGNGSPTYSPGDEGGPALNAGINPGALAVDSAGDIFVVDQSVCTVRVIPASSPNIYTIAGDPTQSCGYSGDSGPATSAQLNNPGGIKVDTAGNLYISDTGNNLIRMVANTPPIISAFVASTCFRKFCINPILPLPPKDR